MQEREIRAFVTIADARRMDRAAQQLGYSQPAISYQIKCLEKSLRTKLFERTPEGVRLTDSGKRILPSAREMLALVERMKRISEVGGNSGANGAASELDHLLSGGHGAPSNAPR
ncbi:regulatory helix-turn-helix protein, lysR family [Actinopolyspora alba]|uniref:Regulatory helix-turn-helix protein, lysR family n=1 Tax=Actinopolyspora alba TaxID=673379 RepID=A0A1I1TX58_9ACTN|nr:LysR family transcriptional regulator [Actinopolyspora alba]SFD60170.1 regulatory helix-turn-helix protein, lysR family [Actinopolyspora alba]